MKVVDLKKSSLLKKPSAEKSSSQMNLYQRKSTLKCNDIKRCHPFSETNSTGASERVPLPRNCSNLVLTWMPWCIQVLRSSFLPSSWTEHQGRSTPPPCERKDSFCRTVPSATHRMRRHESLKGQVHGWHVVIWVRFLGWTYLLVYTQKKNLLVSVVVQLLGEVPVEQFFKWR